MVYYHGLCTTFGLCSLTRIVNDKRVEMRGWAEHHLGETLVRQGQRFARQPLHIAMLAHVDDGIGAELVAHPEVKREVVMRRH